MEKDLKILKSKTLADGSKYFSLFEKHIPALNAGSSVYLYMLGNLHCICEIIKKNPNSKYFIYDADEVINAVQIVMDNIDISKTVDLYDIDMKFDCIIMNPPYDGQTNLYGKISLVAKQHANCVVCLSPYLNYISNKKSFKDVANKLEKTLECYELIPSAVFDAAFDKELCIFKFGSRNENVKFEDLFWNKFLNIDLAKSIINKFKKYNDYCNCHTVSYDDLDNYKFKCIMTFKRGNFDNQTGNPSWDWTTLFSKKYQTKFDWSKSDIKTSNCQAICFETEQECKNFCEYCNTDIVMFIIYAYKMSLSQSSNLQYIPFLKSYINAITEEDIKIGFNLTDEELNYIHDEMKNFGWKTQI